MKLEFEDGTVFKQPSEDEIEQALDKLGRQGNSFAILSKDVMTYIQAAGSRDAGFRLEYQADNTEHHYHVLELVTYDEIVSVFRRYAKGNMSWKQDYPWEREDVGAETGSGCMGVVLIILVLLSVVARVVSAACCI